MLPLRRTGSNGQRRWQSGSWLFRDGVLFLIPGDAPIGFRLPLDSLPWADPASIAFEQPADPFAPSGPLPSRRISAASPIRRRRGVPQASSAETGYAGVMPQGRPEVGREAPDLVRTALAVEARDGKLHVFFPPLIPAEDWLDLVAAIEDTAGELGGKVVLEGYPPPRDPRLNQFCVTPDPGVIEVNIHPAEHWAEHGGAHRRSCTRWRAKKAWPTQKFMLDGRHVGTGGGNHVVMGAATPEDSPFLRRPDLLKSLLGFWHNHPSLSYAFSGLFIGPTSQHPRIDEARMDSVNELEIAFAQITPQRETPPWLTDRLFRNILADITGNTHRTEFCIDKMYAPENATGRLGLVEFRALEMPPDGRMSLAQMLLMRARWRRSGRRRTSARWCAGAPGCTTISCCRITCEQDFAERAGGTVAAGLPARARLVRAALGVPLPQDRRRDAGRRQPGAAPCAGALARAGRGAGRRRHGALRGQLAPNACRRASPAGWTNVSCWPATAARCR